MSWSERSVEWVRTEVPFGNWLVDEVEHVYYTSNAPKKGGPALKRLPTVGLKLPRRGERQAAAWPPPITPVFAQPLPGEGVWKPTGPSVDGGPPVLVTTFVPRSTIRKSSPTWPGSTRRAPRSGITRAATSRRTRRSVGR